jgi:hypothetical protein
MKIFNKLSCAVLFLITVNFSQAQKVDEIINKYIGALGGKQKLLSINTLKMEGDMNLRGRKLTVLNSAINGVGYRTDIKIPSVPGGKANAFQIMMPTMGWRYFPSQGNKTPVASNEAEIKAGQYLLDLQSTLLNYREKGSKVELMGKEKLDSADCYKLKLTYKSGVTAIIYIDATTYYKVKTIITQVVDGKPAEVAIVFGDFKKNPQGYVYPFSQTTATGTIVYSSIEVNKPLDAALFKPE